MSWTTGALPTTRTLRGVAHRGLTVLVVADSGLVFRSLDNGVTWSTHVVAGTPALKAVEMPSATVAVVVGAGETILRSDDGGASWTPQGPAGAATLFGLRMTSDTAGWACGSGGRLLATIDGATWTPVGVPTTNDLFAVDAAGSRLWVVGGFGTALRSTTGGAGWDVIDLRMETPGDVHAVTLAGAAGVTLTGGGGFIRGSGDDGATWSFATHPLLGATSDYFAFDANRAWVTSGRTRAVVRTANAGVTWTFPSGTTTAWNWQLRQASSNVTVRGNTFATTPQNRNSVWCVMGGSIYKSVDRGDSWTLLGNIPAGFKTNSFYVSPKDSNLWVAATGTPDRIDRTTNAGASWTTTLTVDFTEYGMPLEMNPDKPDTLLLAPEDGRIYRSTDFGATWTILSTPGFRSPCDLVISPGNEANVVVGDGVTGVGLAKIWQSVDGALNFSDRYTSVSSETPTVWSSRLANTTLFATNWSSGGVWRSLDSGANWSQVTTVTSAWGGHTATDDPKLVMYNRYAGSPNYVSTDGGTTFTSSTLASPGSGYACYALDRGTLLDMHSAGIFKLSTTYAVPDPSAQAVLVTAPDGGEVWNSGTVHFVTWTQTNLALVAIEWRAGPLDPWIPVAQVEAAAGVYAWTVPAVATTQAEVRVRDAADATPADVSNAVFTIVNATPTLVVVAPNGGEAWPSGQVRAITWTSGNVADVAIDWRSAEAAAWAPLAASVPAAAGTWNWLVPATATTAARVRVRAVGGAVADSSDAVFSILVPRFLAAPSPLDFGIVPAAAAWDTIRVQNTGTAPLTVSAVVSDNPAFVPGRTSFVVPAGGADTLSVTFQPAGVGADSALFTFTADDSAGTHTLRVRAHASDAIGVAPATFAFALEAARPNPFATETSIRFTLPERSAVALEVFDLGGRRVAVLAEGVRDAGPHAVSFRPGGARGPGEGAGLSAGVYFVRLTAGPHVRTRKLLYLAR